ncbi:MAG: Snf7 family protein [Candidatus Thorarchaeota archaeon]
MRFLTGKKRNEIDSTSLQLKGQLNRLEMSIRNLDHRISEEHGLAREAVVRGDRTTATAHLERKDQLESLMLKYRKQYANLESILIALQEVENQQELSRVYALANEALRAAKQELASMNIDEQMESLAAHLEDIEATGDRLSEDLTGFRDLGMRERVARQMEALEAEVLLEKEGVLPPLRGLTRETETADESSRERRIKEALDQLEDEARQGNDSSS